MGCSMSCRERNKGEREEKEYENSSVGLKSKSARQSIGSIEDEPLTIDESLLIDPKLLFIGSKIGEGAHGIVQRPDCCYQSSASWEYFRRKSFTGELFCSRS
ncbi:hypothetical protein V8G54_009086 [Vigna mungo]|uniref:Uncharacterized protein n=1 Tax=Vigna mungo TaxID=3915 RepID=A0AAQ3S1S1_VIGMU